MARGPAEKATPQQILYVKQRLAVAIADLGRQEEGLALLGEALRESREQLPQEPLMEAMIALTLAKMKLDLVESTAAALERELGPEHPFSGLPTRPAASPCTASAAPRKRKRF